MTGRRLLLVHAHPDDECLNNGATMAAAVAAGTAVTLVTCTRGELGEVLPDDLAHLRGDPEALGGHREVELAAAMAVIGVTDHRFLGADVGVRYRDSGMARLPGGLAAVPEDLAPGSFAGVDLDEAAGHLVRVIRDVRPQVLITYDRTGGYGHPDHVVAHRLALRAVELAADASGEPSWTVAKVYATVWPLSIVQTALRALADSGSPALDPDGPLPGMIVPDDEVTTVIDAVGFWHTKAAALGEHRSQMRVDVSAGVTTQDDGVPVPIVAVEWYALLRGQVAGPFDEDGRETDLFSGIGV
jgi:N-acetyl-1-D-myo-inositol-2-amino-2-deoxy-alpha-D-glucopyranoside deacetylase